MCDPRQEISNAFDTVSGWVGSTLSGLSSTIENVLKNPLPTIATIGLTAIGVPPPIANAMVTAATGGSMEDMVISLATSYAGGQIGAAIGDLAVPELGGIAGYGGAGDLAFQPAASEAILKTVISNASAQGATALLQGKDLDQVLNTALTGAVGGLINTSLRTQFGLDSSKFGDRLIGDATKAAVSSIFNGKDPGEAIGLALTNSAFGALANTAANGLKSTVKDLNNLTAEFETIKTQADDLREEIDSESTRLAGLSKELNLTSTALNNTQANIIASKDLLDIASNAYNGYFVSYNPAAQNEFAKRMGFEELTDYEGGLFWAKNVQREKYADFAERELERVVSFVPVNIGMEAKAIAESESAYLNSTVPKFKEDVETFNTQLTTFNTDNANLNTKVNTYTGLVTDLFGEDGEGGLNKKIEDLLVARDGYIEDLNESVASLTEAAGEQISGAAEDIVDDAVDLLDQNYRTSDEVAEAFANNEAFQGYEPSAADLAKFIGEGKDADLQTSIDSYVDENSIDLEELKKIAGAEGYSFTDAELQSLLQQGDEDAISSRLRSEFDAKAVTPDEARQALTIGGYKPTDADIAAFTGNRSEAALSRDAAIYVDPRYLDYDEAREIARQEGYGDLSASDTLYLLRNKQVGQIDEQQGAQALRDLYDTQAVTRQEAYDAFRSLGYEPSEEELNRFMGKGDEANRLSSLQTEFDPLVTTEDEVRQMYKDLGLPEPTADEIAPYIGKQAETDIYGKLEGVKKEQDAEAAQVAQKAEADQIFDAAEELRRAYDAELARNAEADALAGEDLNDLLVEGGNDTLVGGTWGDEAFEQDADQTGDVEAEKPSGEQTIQLDDGSSVTFDEAGNITNITNADTLESGTGEDTFTGGAGEDTFTGDAEADVVEEEPERIARETAEELARQRTALALGFPNYATYQQFEGNYERYLDAQNELMAKGAEFPDYKTYMEYGGDLNAYEQDLLERDAIAAGFPDHFTQVQYGGSYEAYQTDLQEQARLEEESIAKEEGFPDLATKQQYNGDLASFKNDQAVAEGWPDAATKEEYGTLERYQKYLKDEAELEERGRLWEQRQKQYQDALNEELAQTNGFPDYATYLEFDGDQDAYLASLTLPVAEPEEPTEPVLEPPYTPGEDAEEFLPPEVPYTPGEDAEEFEQIVEPPAEPPAGITEPPYTPGEDAEEFEPPVGVEPPYTPGEDAEEFVPPYTPGEDAEEFVPPVITEPPYTPGEDAEEFTAPPEVPYTPGEDADEFVPPVNQAPYTPGEDAEEFVPPYTPGEDAGEFIPPYTPGEDAEEFIPPYTPGEDAEEFIPPYTPGEDAAEFEPEEEIDPETGLPRIKIPQPSVPPKQTVPPKKPVTPLPPGLTPEQLMQLFGQLGAPGIMGALQPYEMPYYFQIPEEQQFDITQAFSPTLYRLQKE